MPISWRNCAPGIRPAPRKTTQVKITTTISTPPLTTTTPTKAIWPNKITPITIRPNPTKAPSDRRWVAPSDNTTLLASLYREVSWVSRPSPATSSSFCSFRKNTFFKILPKLEIGVGRDTNVTNDS
jgi:hypothetical protein